MIKPMVATFSVDEENSAEDWWTAARKAKHMPPALRPLFDTNGSMVVVDAHDAPAILAWCKALPGWEGGPRHAPHPLRCSLRPRRATRGRRHGPRGPAW